MDTLTRKRAVFLLRRVIISIDAISATQDTVDFAGIVTWSRARAAELRVRPAVMHRSLCVQLRPDTITMLILGGAFKC